MLKVKYGMYHYYEYKGTPLSEMAGPEVRLKAVLKYDEWYDDDMLLYTYPKSGEFKHTFNVI